MDLGTIILLIVAGAIVLDIFILLAGPRIRGFERSSLLMALIGSLSAIFALLWMAFLIFTNNFQYEYVYSITEISSPWWLKISGLWAGQSGSLLFWTAISFGLYLGFRLMVQGYEDDVIVYRASILMALQSLFILANTIIADPFRYIVGTMPTDGMGMNPLLRTVWNAVHPPIIFIGYAMVMVPFAIKLAGFTVRKEERSSDSIPVLEKYSSSMTIAAWALLSLGIAIGGYWAYIVLGWGGYWAWDPVETSSLIPWLLLTAYFHGKAVLKDNDVIRDGILVFAYVSVLFATWVTRSGVLTSVHGFQLTLISWTMLATVLFGFILATIITIRAGFVDLEDDEDESSNWKSMFSLNNIRDLSLKVSLIGILIIVTSSVIGVALPAGINLSSYFADPVNFDDNMVSISIEFFRGGFYLGAFFLVISAFYCMKTESISLKLKSIFVLLLLAIGGVLGIASMLNPDQILPTNYWPANALIPLGIGALLYLIIVFIRTMVGKERGPFTMRKVGRLMLHLGLVFLVVGVFFSENVVFETSRTYRENDSSEIAPGIEVWVTDIAYYSENDYYVVQVVVIEGNITVGVGYSTITRDSDWGSLTHQVFVHSTGARDVFIALTGFEDIDPSPFTEIYVVALHTKVLPLISFVWLGIFLGMMAILPMMAIEFSGLIKAIRSKETHLYGDDEKVAEEVEPIQE